MSDIISPLSGNIAEEPAMETTADTQRQAKELPVRERKLGIALVGLGTYSEQQLGPALTETAYCYLAAVVSGSEKKRQKWQHEYNLKSENIYDYVNFDSIRANRDIDIVYVVLPNAMHTEYVIRAAEAGKHVICEKPLATSVEDCYRMIDACRKAGVKLSVGYRLHFDPLNQEMMRMGQNRLFGSVERVIAQNGMDVGTKDQWRLNRNLAGGGPLMDVGIYCVQAALYTIGELPTAVKARFLPKTNPGKFTDIEEGIEWEMQFSLGAKAVCQCSYSQEQNILRTEAVNGWFELQPAYEYTGIKGSTSEGPMTQTSTNQQAAQMDDFALCVQNNTETRVPGEMGLRDVQILMAIYEAASTGKSVALNLGKFANLVEI